MNNQKRIAIIGATSAIAEQCGRLWIKQDVTHLILLGRSRERLEVVAKDFLVRNPRVNIEMRVANFLDPEEIVKTVGELFIRGPIDIALIAHGSLPEQSECQEDLMLCKETLYLNGISPVLYAEAFAQHMSNLNQGTIAIIGSVAGDRGRKSNYVYGAAKGLINRYAQGLQHRFAGSKVQVTLIKPGPTATPMTAKMKGKFATAQEVASTITKGINQKKSVIYVPGKWWLVMMVIRHLPSFIFNKLNI